jgi:hypothetical protein
VLTIRCYPKILQYVQGDLPFVSSGIGGYVTGKGIFKNYPDQATFDSTAGKNGCPADITKGVKKDNYSSILKNGTDMKSGQSCGNEGKNVYVSRVLTDPTVTYQKCYYNTIRMIVQLQVVPH